MDNTYRMSLRSAILSIIQRIIDTYYDPDKSNSLKELDIFMLLSEYPSKSDRVLTELKRLNRNVYAYCAGMMCFSVHYREYRS